MVWGDNVATEQQRSEKLISFRNVVNRAIFNISSAILEGRSIVRELEFLDILLSPYYDRKFKSRTKVLEEKFKILDTIPSSAWPYPKKPSWASRYARLLIDLAKRKGLLDVEEWVDW